MLEVNKNYLGDARDLFKQLDDNSVSLIFTDPPYPRKYAEECYKILAEESERVLVPHGSLVTIVPQYFLPETIKLFDGKLKYRWSYVMDQQLGSHPRMLMGIEVCYKLMLHYVKGTFKNIGFLKDVVSIGKPDKGLHVWQQSKDWAGYYVNKLSGGGLVLDPFMGVGTVGVVCKQLEIPWIGFEIEEETLNKANERISSYERLV
jgi:DNA modification methylase